MTTIWAKVIRAVKNHTLGFYHFAEGIKENSTLEIAASNLYRLFVNGNLVGYGPARAAHGYVRKDVYDLSSYANQNIHIVIEVFAANVNSYYIVDELPFFGALLKIGDKAITAEEFRAYLLSDRVSQIQRYSFQRTFAESYKMEQCRSKFYLGDTSMFDKVETERVSCNQIIERGIDYPDLKYVPYTNEIEYGLVTVNQEKAKWKDRALLEINERFKGYRYEELEECISDEVSEFEYTCFGEKSESENIKNNTYKVFDFGRTLTGFFDVKLRAFENSVIYLIWDEIISDNKGYKDVNFSRNSCCSIMKYTLKKEDYRLLSFEVYTARYVKLIVLSGEISIDNVGMVLYENKNAFNFQFRCEDEKLNAIVKAAANTFAQNAVDVLMDCPSRERAGWLCDAYFSGRAEKLFTGKNEIERNFLENYILSPQSEYLPKGMLPMCYPADHNDGVYIPNWAMWFVIELSDYYKRTADQELIEKAEQRVYDLIGFFKKYINEDGLLENLESWVFIEWSKCNDAEYVKGVNYPSNMLYAALLKAAGELYGDNALISQSEKMKKAIVEQSFNGTFFEDNRIRENGVLTAKNHLTETCQYYAFYFDIAKKDGFPKLFETMVNEFGPKRDTETVYRDIAKSNAIVGNYLRLEILLKNGYKEKVLEECKDFFYDMAIKTGTLWEHSFVSSSLNHGFASVAAKYIYEEM